MEVSGQLDTPAALPTGKETLVCTEMRLDGPQDKFECCGVEKIMLPLPARPQPVTILIKLSRCKRGSILNYFEIFEQLSKLINFTIPVNSF
jgi:hypothetical protein